MMFILWISFLGVPVGEKTYILWSRKKSSEDVSSTSSFGFYFSCRGLIQVPNVIIHAFWFKKDIYYIFSYACICYREKMSHNYQSFGRKLTLRHPCGNLVHIRKILKVSILYHFELCSWMNLLYWLHWTFVTSQTENIVLLNYGTMAGKPRNSTGFILISANGGLNQQRVAVRL